MASNSSQESSGTTEVERKYCKKCNIRMSSVVFDNHSLCISCRGTDCNFHNQCDVCKEWAPEQMELYVKHRRTLASKNRSKKDKRDKKDGNPKACTTFNTHRASEGCFWEHNNKGETCIYEHFCSWCQTN